MWNLWLLIRNVCDKKAVEFLQQYGIIPKTLECIPGHQMKLKYLVMPHKIKSTSY